MFQVWKGVSVRIAILEDDTALLELYQVWLVADGHSCKCYEDGKSLLKALGRETFDLAILDWELPDISGTEVLTYLRKQLDWRLPVLFATNRDNEEDIVFALKSGADDYMIKPVKQNELLARIGAIARRTGLDTDNDGVVDTLPYQFDAGALTVNYEGKSVTLTRKELDLALFLFRNKGRLLSRGHIMESVWGQNAELNTRTVDTHVSAVRQKIQLGPERGWRLASIYGHGYRLESV